MKSQDKNISERKLHVQVAQTMLRVLLALSCVFRIIKKASACTEDVKSFNNTHRKRPRKKMIELGNFVNLHYSLIYS